MSKQLLRIQHRIALRQIANFPDFDQIQVPARIQADALLNRYFAEVK